VLIVTIKQNSLSLKINNAPQLSEITIRLRAGRWGISNSIDILVWNQRRVNDIRRKIYHVMSMDNDGLYFNYIYEWVRRDIGVDVSSTCPYSLICDGIDFEW
jgi:hypothetical protein